VKAALNILGGKPTPSQQEAFGELGQEIIAAMTSAFASLDVD
jgi:hypothetical protein